MRRLPMSAAGCFDPLLRHAKELTHPPGDDGRCNGSLDSWQQEADVICPTAIGLVH